jgi:hypothetical protein
MEGCVFRTTFTIVKGIPDKLWMVRYVYEDDQTGMEKAECLFFETKESALKLINARPSGSPALFELMEEHISQVQYGSKVETVVKTFERIVPNMVWE